MVALLIASSLQMYFSFQAQQKILLTNQKLIAKNTANTVENFVRDKFNTLEAASRRRNLVILPKDEQEATLDRFMGLEPAFRQLALLNKQAIETAKVSRTAALSSRLMNYSQDEMVHKVRQKEQYIGPVYIDEATSEPMMINLITG